MDRKRFMLLDAIKTGAQARGEVRLYARGKLPGLFEQRTRETSDLANQAVQDGLLEMTRVETVGKTTVEWMRVTQKGLDLLLESESPIRALEELRDALAVHRHGLPDWATQLQATIDSLSRDVAAEIGQVRAKLDQLADRVNESLARFKTTSTSPTPTTTPWAADALRFLESRHEVGLGTRCSLADLFAALRGKHNGLTLREFHAGIRRLREGAVLTLHPGTQPDDAPGPEYALLDGAAVYYYVGLPHEKGVGSG